MLSHQRKAIPQFFFSFLLIGKGQVLCSREKDTAETDPGLPTNIAALSCDTSLDSTKIQFAFGAEGKTMTTKETAMIAHKQTNNIVGCNSRSRIMCIFTMQKCGTENNEEWMGKQMMREYAGK